MAQQNVSGEKNWQAYDRLTLETSDAVFDLASHGAILAKEGTLKAPTAEGIKDVIALHQKRQWQRKELVRLGKFGELESCSFPSKIKDDCACKTDEKSNCNQNSEKSEWDEDALPTPEEAIRHLTAREKFTFRKLEEHLTQRGFRLTSVNASVVWSKEPNKLLTILGETLSENADELAKAVKEATFEDAETKLANAISETEERGTAKVNALAAISEYYARNADYIADPTDQNRLAVQQKLTAARTACVIADLKSVIVDECSELP